jgi:hypothetical protein
MHCATPRSCTSAFASSCGEKLDPPEPGGWGANSWHLARAAWTAGAAGLIPAVLNVKPPPGLGSGKLGTPCARMQLANARASGAPALGPVEREPAASRVAVLDPAVVLAPLLASFDAEVVAPATVAAAWLGEPPPQLASTIALTSNATARGGARNQTVGGG